MSNLPSIGTLQYNGFDFPTETRCTGISMVPLETKDGRAFLGNRVTASYEFYVLASSDPDVTIDDTVDDLEAILLQHSAVFVCQNRGFGDLTVSPDETGDLMYGPKPREFKWIPVGGNRAALVNWTIEFTISVCTDDPYGRPMDFSYTITFSSDESRNSKRAYKGEIRIPACRIAPGNKRVAFSVDQYYKLCVPPVPVGWRRTNEERTPSEDRTQLAFSFTDTQIPVPAPAGVDDWEFTHHQHATGAAPVFPVWHGTMSAWYKMFPYAQPGWALNYFLAAAKDRLNALVDSGAVANPNTIIITDFDMGESVKSRTTDFSLSYDVTAPIGQLMTAALWRSLPGHSHQLWAQSASQIMIAGGTDQSVFSPNLDAIIDVCTRQNVPTPPSAGQPIKLTFGPGNASITVPCPTPENSFLYVRIFLYATIDQGSTVHKPLPPKAPGPVKPTPGTGLSLGQQAAQAAFGGDNGADAGKMTTAAGNAAAQGVQAANKGSSVSIQQNHAPVIHVTLFAQIVRACYQPGIPILVQVGNAQAVPDNREDVEGVWLGLVGNLGVPIYALQVQQRYVLTSFPQQPIGSPATPTIGKGDTGLSSHVGGGGPPGGSVPQIAGGMNGPFK